MKKIVLIVLLALGLSGCAQKQELETIGNPCVAVLESNPQTIQVSLPEEISTPVIQNEENGKLYLCEGYTLTLQTLEGGDINRTIKSCTGFSKDELTVLETTHDDVKRYDCVWTAIGEGADQVGRLAVLDDGAYHYVLTVMAQMDEAGELSDKWQEIFNSFALGTDQ